MYVSSYYFDKIYVIITVVYFFGLYEIINVQTMPC